MKDAEALEAAKAFILLAQAVKTTTHDATGKPTDHYTLPPDHLDPDVVIKNFVDNKRR